MVTGMSRLVWKAHTSGPRRIVRPEGPRQIPCLAREGQVATLGCRVTGMTPNIENKSHENPTKTDSALRDCGRGLRWPLFERICSRPVRSGFAIHTGPECKQEGRHLRRDESFSDADGDSEKVIPTLLETRQGPRGCRVFLRPAALFVGDGDA
jgi:hypothetical protein